MSDPIEIMAKRLSDVVGYNAPVDNRETFDILHRHVYGLDGQLNREGRRFADDAERARYSVFVQCCVSAVPKAFRTCLFRRDDVKELEEQANEVIKEISAAYGVDAVSMSFGNTIRFDAAYHSFLFAFRSCLEYFEVGVRSYFNIKGSGFRRLGTDLAKVTRAPAAALSSIHANRVEDFVGFALGWDGLRNRVAHSEFLKPAHVVALGGKLRLVGGGESMAPDGSASLADLLARRLGLLDCCHRRAQVPLPPVSPVTT